MTDQEIKMLFLLSTQRAFEVIGISNTERLFQRLVKCQDEKDC